MNIRIIILAAISSLTAPTVHAQTYAVLEQDTHRITLAVVDSISSPHPTTRRFSTVSIAAWPELWQKSYGQIFESEAEVDCWNRQITIFGGPDKIRDIQGNHIASSVGEVMTLPLSDELDAYEQFFCHNTATVSTTPFRDLEEVKHYYFGWLNGSIPKISARRP